MKKAKKFDAYTFKKKLRTYSKILAEYWKRIPPETKGKSSFYMNTCWRGNSTAQDPLLLIGLELVSYVHTSLADVENLENGTEVLSVRFNRYVGEFAYTGRGKKFCYEATIIQDKDPTSDFGKWLQTQAHQGIYDVSEDFAAASERKVYLLIVVDAPTQSESTHLKRLGADKPLHLLLSPVFVIPFVDEQHLFNESYLRELNKTLIESLSTFELDFMCELSFYLGLWLVSPISNKTVREVQKKNLEREISKLSIPIGELSQKLNETRSAFESAHSELKACESEMQLLNQNHFLRMHDEKTKLASCNDKISKLENELRRLRGLRIQKLTEARQSIPSRKMEKEISYIQEKEKSIPLEINMTIKDRDQLTKRISQAESRYEQKKVLIHERLLALKKNSDFAAEEKTNAEKELENVLLLEKRLKAKHDLL